MPQIALLLYQTLPSHHRVFIPVVFLPRAKGPIAGRLVVQWGSNGTSPLTVPLAGHGLRNVYRLKAFTDLVIPVDTRISPPIVVHNPHDRVFHIKEVFTTESFLHLSLPESQLAAQRRSAGGGGGAKFWEIGPRRNKYIISLSFSSSKPGLFLGYVHLKTDDHSIILPTEITVVEGALRAWRASAPVAC